MSKEIIYQQSEELLKKYRYLNVFSEGKYVIIKGCLEFTAEYMNNTIADVYNIQITIPEEYPKFLPSVNELDGKIDKTYHHFTNGNMCLGTNAELYLKFADDKTLLAFVEQFIIPYLFNHSMFLETGKTLTGERLHKEKGLLGILEFYYENFEINNKMDVLKVLTYIIKGEHYYKHLCPCGSKNSIIDCHGSKMTNFRNKRPSYQIEIDYYKIAKSFDKPKKDIQGFFYLKSIMKEMEKQLKRNKCEQKKR